MDCPREAARDACHVVATATVDEHALAAASDAVEAAVAAVPDDPATLGGGVVGSGDGVRRTTRRSSSPTARTADRTHV